MWICNTRWPPPQNKVLVNDPLEKQMHIVLETADPIKPYHMTLNEKYILKLIFSGTTDHLKQP